MRSNHSVLKEISPEYSLEGLMLRLKLQYFGHLMRRVDSLEKILMLGGIGSRRRRGTTGDEMVGWHHRLDAHEFGWTPGVGDGQGGLVCWDSWGHKSDMTGRLNWTEKDTTYLLYPTGQNPKEVMFLPQMPTVRKPILDQSSNKLIIHKNHQDLWFKCKLWFIGSLADTGTAFQTSS